MTTCRRLYVHLVFILMKMAFGLVSAVFINNQGVIRGPYDVCELGIGLGLLEDPMPTCQSLTNHLSIDAFTIHSMVITIVVICLFATVLLVIADLLTSISAEEGSRLMCVSLYLQVAAAAAAVLNLYGLSTFLTLNWEFFALSALTLGFYCCASVIALVLYNLSDWCVVDLLAPINKGGKKAQTRTLIKLSTS